jgi:hypothetical protein
VVPIVVFFTNTDAKGNTSPLLFFKTPCTSVALAAIEKTVINSRGRNCFISVDRTNIIGEGYINSLQKSFNT